MAFARKIFEFYAGIPKVLQCLFEHLNMKPCMEGNISKSALLIIVHFCKMTVWTTTDYHSNKGNKKWSSQGHALAMPASSLYIHSYEYVVVV